MSCPPLQRRITDGTVTVASGSGNRTTVDTAGRMRVFWEPLSQRVAVTMPDITQADLRQIQHQLELVKQAIDYLKLSGIAASALCIHRPWLGSWWVLRDFITGTLHQHHLPIQYLKSTECASKR